MKALTTQVATGRASRRTFLRSGLTAVAGALLLPRPVWGLGSAPDVVRRTLWAMGGWHHLSVSGDDTTIAAEALSAAVDELRLFDRTFSVFDQRTPLSRLNRSSLNTIAVDDELMAEGLAHALARAAETQGAFDPTVEALMRRWGFRDDAIALGSRTSIGPDTCDYREIEFDAANGLIRRASPQITIDPGGWAKGWAAQRAALAAVSVGVRNATVNCGGDIYYAGVRSESDWHTEIRHPAGRRFEALLDVRHRFPAVATSANTESYRSDAGGQQYGHLLDPRSAKPAETDCVSATVFGADGLAVDAVASALFVMGIGRAQEWLAGHSQFAAVLIQDGWSNDPRRVHVHGSLGVVRC